MKNDAFLAPNHIPTFININDLLDWCRDNLSTKQKLFIQKASRITRNKLYTRKDMPVFQYDLLGNFIREYNTTTDVSIEMKCPIVSIYTAIKRRSVYNGKWYFFREKEFTPRTPKKYNRNPLMRDYIV